MPILHAPLTSAIFEFADGLFLGKLLQFSAASSMHRRQERLVDDLRIQAEKLSDFLDPLSLHGRQLAADVRHLPLQVSIDPRRNDPAWRTPIDVKLDAFVWEANELHHAVLPLLNICVVGDSEEQLIQRTSSQARFILARNNKATLESLLMLPQPTSSFCERTEWTINAKTPKEIYRLTNATESVSVLKDIAEDLSKIRLHSIVGRRLILQQMAELMSAKQPSSVLLVGDSGVGKTAIVHDFVRSRHELALPFRQYWQTSGSRIVAGMCGFGEWQNRCEELCIEVRETEAWLHLGNLFELMEVGQHEASEQGIGDYLRSYIDHGKLPCTAECTPQQLDEIQRRNPRILDAFEHIQVPQTTRKETREILRALATRLLGPAAPLPQAAMDASLQLHDRFATYSARPGRVARFFTYLIEANRVDTFDNNSPSNKSKSKIRSFSPVEIDVETTIASFSQQTGLPRQILDDAVPLDLDSVEAWFGRRVIGQPQAVSHVLDALASVKTSLTRPGRPIASLLMIGPTGVGKTELAKSLTEFLYRNPDRMTRIDMSEYADPLAAERLAGSSWQDEGLLTSRVREQPFGVVLLDEFEKAHPDVFDLLLQILGEGRLSDAVGRVADFSTSVVIMTSNLGAETARKSDFGFRGGEEETARNQSLADHYVKEVQKFLRPEIYNRIDSIVPFAPLSRETVRRIVENQLHELKTHVRQRAEETQTEFDASVVDLIADKGYEPSLGARPIRRQIERLVLAPIASRLNEKQTKRGGVISVSAVGDRVRVRLKGADDDTSELFADRRGAKNDGLATQVMTTRRCAQAVGKNYMVEDLRNEHSRLSRRKLRLEARKKMVEPKLLADLGKIERELDAIETHIQKCVDSEQETLLWHYGLDRESIEVSGVSEHATQQNDGAVLNSPEERVRTAKELQAANQSFIFELFAKSCREQRITLFVFGDSSGWPQELAMAYQALCDRWKMDYQASDVFIRRAHLTRLPERSFAIADPKLQRELSKQKDKRDIKAYSQIDFWGLASADEDVEKYRSDRFGLAIELDNPLALARLQAEAGYHHRIKRGETERAEVVTSIGKILEYTPPQFRHLREQLRANRPRRVYNLDKMLVEDELAKLNRKMKRSDKLEVAVEHFVVSNFENAAKKWFES